jgi:cell division septal protein FtsQ
MKLIIHSTERKEYVNLPERELDDLPRTIRSADNQTSPRAMLGQAPADGLDEEMKKPELLGTYSQNSSTGEYDETPTDEEVTEPEEGEAEASWKHSRWPGALFITAILVLGMIWYLASRSDGGLRLSHVKIEGAALLSNEEVLQLAGINASVPFYQINLKQIEERLMTHSLIRSAHVRRELSPATLVLSIEERQPVALLRSDSTAGASAGETFIIDRDGVLLRPKLIAGLRNPSKILQVPLLSGVSARDTMRFQAMSKLVMLIASLDSGALKDAIGELHQTPTGAYVIYTSQTETPMFLGSPFDREFHTALEDQLASASPKNETSLFYRQLNLLATVWKAKLRSEILAGHALYVDARFNGQIILKHKFQQQAATGVPVPQAALQSEPNHAHYATNANKRSPN